MRGFLLICTARLMLLTLLALPASMAPAQTQAPTDMPATLIANAINFDGPSETIVASGAVEVFYQGTILRAERIRYAGRAGSLQVEGPMTLTDPTGRTVLLADFAELSDDLQEGVLQSARLVLDRQLQIAATEINRTEGRYTQLYQTVASSCEICANNPTPLWEIRARRIVHDQQERQLWFEQAQFRALGVPIAYFPRLRLPDPTLERANGFLTPRVFGNDTIGTGLETPYFIMLGAHRDLTFAPYVTSDGYSGVGLRYRQAFARGWLSAEGRLSFDDLTNDAVRGYVFADGFFELPRDFVLDLQLQGVTDRGYLTTYGISGLDRLESHAIASRTERDEYIEAGLTQYNSLRAADDNRTLPNTIFDAEWTHRYDVPGVGGVARLSFGAHSHVRADQSDMTGRDVNRLSAEAAWRRDVILPFGLLLAAEADVYADYVSVSQDSTFPQTQTRLAPTAAIELSWPLARVTNRGVTHLIEPTMQLAWSDDGGGNVPNEDSTVVSFDEANLFALNRFPGSDRREDGRRTALGVTYTRTDPLGWSLGTTVGRVWRADDTMQFTSGSGLDGVVSDWMVALHLRLGTRVNLINRALFDDGFNYTSNEMALSWLGDRHALNSNVTWLAADIAEGRPDDTAELYVSGAYDFGRGWSAEADWRFDFAENDSRNAGLALTYATECVDVEFSLSRRFTSSATVTPATEFGLRVALNGFGATRNGRSHDRSCH